MIFFFISITIFFSSVFHSYHQFFCFFYFFYFFIFLLFPILILFFSFSPSSSFPSFFFYFYFFFFFSFFFFFFFFFFLLFFLLFLLPPLRFSLSYWTVRNGLKRLFVPSAVPSFSSCLLSHKPELSLRTTHTFNFNQSLMLL